MALTVCVVSALASAAEARQRLIRPLDARHGPAVQATSLAQDARGFLWIGTVGGLSRYDGLEVRRIAADTLVTCVAEIRPDRDDELYTLDLDGQVFRVTGETATRADGPDGRPLGAVNDLWVGRDHALWIAGHELRRRDPDGRWSAPVEGVTDPLLVREAADGTIYVASRSTVWRLDQGRAVAVASLAKRLADLLPAADGSLYLAERAGAVRRLHGGETTDVIQLGARAIALAQRGEVIWVSYDRHLVALRPGAPPEVLARKQGIPLAERMLVDAEGSLWLATASGALQLPEPETTIWSESDGVPFAPRFLVESDEGIWVGSWSSVGRIDRDAGRCETVGRPAASGICRDGAGRIWFADEAGLTASAHGELLSYPVSGMQLPNPCDTAPDGRVWFPFRDGVYRTRLEPGPPERIAAPPPDSQPLDVVHEDRKGRLWVGARDRLCWAALGAAIDPNGWSCQRIQGAVSVNDFEETEGGTLWAATEQAGVQRWDEAAARWEPVPASLHLASRVVLGLAPSPRGGMWILGHGITLRVRERRDAPGGWEVLEAPGVWNGIPSPNTADALETGDGTLWLVGAGIYQVPASMRGLALAPPRVAVTEVNVDGELFDAARPLELPYSRNRVRLSFAALSFRDPGLLRYRMRMGDGAVESLRLPFLRLNDVRPGAHRAEVSASLDGITWSPPASFSFRVRGPWWREPWAIGLLALIVAGGLFAAHRVSLVMSLRLERQRSHIAMDLHDELGSGLGSIGILAAIASDQELPEPRRRAVAAEIIDTAEDLGGSLGDIVWSLRPGSSTLDGLLAHIVERGACLLPDERVAFTIDVPAPLPAVALSLPVCRGLQLIAFEALHNAARHAGARRVALGLARADRRSWRMWIEDDGVGIPPAAPDGDGWQNGGLGLASMARRARAIGADLRIAPGPGGGTRVELTFSHVRAKGRDA